MALRAFYFIRALTKALTYYYINRSQRHLLAAIENNWLEGPNLSLPFVSCWIVFCKFQYISLLSTRYATRIICRIWKLYDDYVNVIKMGIVVFFWISMPKLELICIIWNRENPSTVGFICICYWCVLFLELQNGRSCENSKHFIPLRSKSINIVTMSNLRGIYFLYFNA